MGACRWLTLTALAACLLVAPLLAQEEDVPDEWSKLHYPNPQVDLYKCGRYGKKSYVCDPNHILSLDEANQLDVLIERVLNETKCPCSRFTCQDDKHGYRIGVALMRKITKSDKDKTNSDDIQNLIDTNLNEAKLFAYTLEQNWGFGNCDEDVVILYSLNDNVLYSMTGEATRLKLKDTTVGEISMNARMKFGHNRDNFEGLRKMILDFRAVFDNAYTGMPIEKPMVAALTDGSSAATHATAAASLLISMLTTVVLL